MSETGQSTMITLSGTRFACKCGANVFTRHADNPAGEAVYSCNGCATVYASSK